MPPVPEASSALGLRVVSGVVLGLVGLGAAVAGGWAFAGLAAITGVVIAFEWDRLNGGPGSGPVAWAHAAAVVAAVALTVSGQFLWAIVAIAGAGAATFALARDRDRSPLTGAVGVVYVSLAPVALIWLRDAPEAGLFAVVWVFSVVWATDIGAFFTGRAIGGPKLAPTISPGKTWSGFAGGIAAAGVAGWVAATIGGVATALPLVIASLVISVVGQVGDLAISKVKRQAGVKDTGRIIPGHGGVLDRLDSMLPAVSLAAAGVYVIQQRGLEWL